MIERHKRSLAAAAAFMYGFYDILEVWPLNIPVALESASLGQGHIFMCKDFLT